MCRIRSLEILFNLVKSQLKAKEECLVAALHCLLINENLQCVGTGEAFSESDARSLTELLPKDWNANKELYTLRYRNKDLKKRFLMKIVKTGHLLHVNAVLNEEEAAAMTVNVDKYVADDFSEYSTTYQELDDLSSSFHSEILEKLINPKKEKSPKPRRASTPPIAGPAHIPATSRPMPDFDYPNNDPPPFPRLGGRPFPSVGGSDLDPLGRGQGGMILDPSGFGVPSRPHMPPFGRPPGLPRGAVPPGARFDPFGPPVRGPNRFDPGPDHFKPPDYDDDDFM